MIYALVKDGYIEQLAHGIEPPASEWVAVEADVPSRPSTMIRPKLTAALCWVETATDEDRAHDARQLRGRLLADSDWRVTAALEAGGALPQPWREYRQALRDIPEQPGFPGSVNWPVPPT